MLRAWSTAVVSANPEKSKKAGLCKSIKEAKRQHRLKLEAYYTTADSWHMCQGLQHHRQQAEGFRGQPEKSHILRDCSSELADVLTVIYNLSLSQSSLPTCFKSTTLVPLPKNCTLICLNDVNHIAFTPILCFESVLKGSSWYTSKGLSQLHWTHYNSCIDRISPLRML